MRRPVKKAPARAIGYPRLSQAWRVLLGAAPLIGGALPAQADSSVPPCHTQVKPNGNPRPPEPRLDGDLVSPTRPRPPVHSMPLGGALVAVQPPKKPEPPKIPSPPPPKDSGDGKAALPKPKRPELEPMLQGLFGARVAPPDPRAPVFVIAAADAPLEEGAIWIHPHGPDEPCRRRG